MVYLKTRNEKNLGEGGDTSFNLQIKCECNNTPVLKNQLLK